MASRTLAYQVNQACVTALTPWKNPRWMEKGVAMGLVHTRKVVTTDASNTGWGALCEGKPTFGHWSKTESSFHINCLEMLAVCRACQFFLPDLIGCHVLIRSDNMSVVSYINFPREVSTRSASLFWQSTFWNGLSSTCARWGQHTCRADWTKERICYLGAMSPQRSGCSIRRWFRRSGRPLARQK